MRRARVIRSGIRTCSSCSTLASVFTLRSTSSTSPAEATPSDRSAACPSTKLSPIPFSILPTRLCLSILRRNNSAFAEIHFSFGEASAEWAAKNFFRESNLTALREMALRLVAEHVDRDLRDIMSEEKIAGPWKSGDRLLVAVSASPYSERLIRYTRRLAASMEASWIVANIERPRPLSQEEQARLTRYLALARQLGAEVISTAGTEVGETLLRIARQHNVTQIVIGKPLGGRWLLFWKRDPLRWLMRNSGNIDIHMIPAEESAAPRRETIEERLARAPWRDFVIALAIAAIVTAISLSIFTYTGYYAVALFYLLAVVLAGMRLRRWPTLFLAALSALLWNFLYVPPRFTFYIS